jgi:hypothetical protein
MSRWLRNSANIYMMKLMKRATATCSTTERESHGYEGMTDENKSV